MIFKEDPSFYISSVDSSFLNQIYSYYLNKGFIQFGKHELEITNIGPVEDIKLHQDQEYMIQTISPITCYKTDEKKYKTYFNPKSFDFEQSILDNVRRKSEALGLDHTEDSFSIKDVKWMKETKVKFKGNIISAYHVRMIINTSDAYLKLFMHTGMGSKNSSGFGMIKIVD